MKIVMSVGFRTVLGVVAMSFLGLAVAVPAAGASRLPSGDPGHALVLWQGFPAHAQPRPIVLIEGTPDGRVAPPPGGFATDADKEAFLSGQFVAPAQLPSGPATAGGYKIESAARALAELRSSGSGRSPTKLTISGVRLGSASFLTDRGWQQLPAWLFSLVGVTNPAAVLAVSRGSLYWPHGLHQGQAAHFGATESPGSRTLDLGIAGWPSGPGPCTASYTASVYESGVAVAIWVHQKFHPPPSGTACAAVASVEPHLKVRLKVPLGPRVVLDDANGEPVAVTP